MFSQREGKLFESHHRRDTCMQCFKKPEYEILWTEGRAHAWFCDSCLKKWATTGDGWHRIDYVKAIKDGEAAKNFKDNTNPDILSALKKKYKLKESKINSPTFAYQAVYGKEPADFLSGRAGGKEKEYKNGIMIDEHLDPEWFDELNKIKEIELRSSCEGHSPDRVAYIVFRMEDESKAQKVSEKLNKVDGLYSKFDIGQEGRLRIVVAGKVWYGQSRWEQWWKSLASKIREVIRESELKASKFIKLNNIKEIIESREMVLNTKRIMGNYFLLVDDNKKYGFINFGQPELVEDLREKKEGNKYYVYKVRDFISLEKSENIKVPEGIQLFGDVADLKESEFKPERFVAKSISELSDLELVQRHAEIHEIWEQRGKRKDDELIITAHMFITDELKKRSLEHRPKEILDVIELIESVQDKSLLTDAIKYFDRDFYLKDPFLALTGGTVVSGYGADNDIWVNWSLDASDKCPQCARILEQLDFRLRSMLPKNKEELLHFIPEPEGRFTNYIPIARLKVEMIPPEERELLKMSIQEQVPHAGSAEIIKMAKDSEKEDKIKLFRFFLPMKPTRAAKPNKRMTVDFYVSLWKPENFKVGIMSSKKYDGINLEIHADRKKKKIIIWTEDGEDVTDRLPQHQEQIWDLKFEDNIIFLAELEKWRDRVRLPGEITADYLHGKEPQDQKNDFLVSNVYTLVYLDGKDLHKNFEIEKQELLKKMNFLQSTWNMPDYTKKNFNLAPYLTAHSTEELKKNVAKVRWEWASEGDVGKTADAIHYLNGKSKDKWIKFHNNAMIFGTVLERITTKVPTIFNYRYGIDPEDYKVEEKNLVELEDKEYIEVGKSFNTDIKLDIGEMIAVECETFNFIKDEKTGTVAVSAWVPRFINLEDVEMKIPKETDTITDVLNRARKNKILQIKRITKKSETLYESLTPEYSEVDSIETIDEFIVYMKENYNIAEIEVRRALCLNKN